MSEDQTTSPSEPQESKPKQGRSPVEKVIWAIIVCVIAGLGLELYAKTSYEDSMAKLDDVFNAKEAPDQRLSDVKSHLTGLTSYGSPVPVEDSSTQQEVKVSWISPTGKYAVTLVLDDAGDDPVVAWYKMGADNWAIDPSTSAGEDLSTGFDGDVTPSMGAMTGEMTAPGSDEGFATGPPGQEGGSGQGGGGRGRRQRGLLGILSEEAVIAELYLTEEQTQKIKELGESLQIDFSSLRDASPEERTKARIETETALQEVLDEQQFTRAWQIDLQRAGVSAIGRSNVADKLNLTGEQSARLAEIIAESNEARSAAMQERNFAAFGEIREQAEQKINELLTDDQKTQWNELLGPPGPEPPQRSGFGGGGGGRGQGGPEGGGRPQRPAANDEPDSASSDSESATDEASTTE